MLKIKDNVDLKKLEKYGMKYNPSSECYVDSYDFILLCIHENDRELQIDINNVGIGFSENYKKAIERATNILYDLIKDGLVEKVKE